MVITTGNCGGGAQISVRSAESAHEQLIGMLPPVGEGRHNRLALCSFQAEMPNNVQTTNKPVVLMTAPERKLNGEGHGIADGGGGGPADCEGEEDGQQQRPAGGSISRGMKQLGLGKQ